MPLPMALPKTSMSGSRFHSRGAAAGAGADGVRFVGDEQRAVAAREFARG